MAKKAVISFRLDDAAVRALRDKLMALSSKVAKEALRKGINDVTREILSLARPLVPRRTGQLRRSLGRKVVTRRDGHGIVGRVGPRKGFVSSYGGYRIDPVKYAHLVEYGRQAVRPKKKRFMADVAMRQFFGLHARAVPPHPFLRPAADAVLPRVPEILTRRLREGIAKYYAGGARSKRRAA